MRTLKTFLIFLFLVPLPAGCAQLKTGQYSHSGNGAYTDNSAKINNAENTEKQAALSAHNVRPVITTVLNEMIEAYKNKDAKTFMTYISGDFAGDKDILHRAVNRDFSLFNNLDLRCVLNTLTSEPNGKIYVTVTYNRFLISTADGESYSDRGTTVFVFEPGPEHPVVYSMKSPLLFGLSEAGEVATGKVISPGNNPVIVVDDRGHFSVMPGNSSHRN